LKSLNIRDLYLCRWYEKFLNDMPHIDSTKFGEIVIDGKKYGQILIIGGAVFERDEKKLRKLFGTTHQIGNWEIEALLQESPEIVIIGTGQEGVLKVENDFFEQMKKAEVEVITALTPKAIDIYNKKAEEGKRINSLIHTTC